MKPLLIALAFSVLFILNACLDPVEVIPYNCPKYVKLNSLNEDSLKTDPITVLDVQFDGDCLVLTLQYGGRCEEHEVDLALIHPLCRTPHFPTPNFDIRHNANGDVCKALITEEYRFDISGIREEGKTSVDFMLNARIGNGEVSSETYTYNY